LIVSAISGAIPGTWRVTADRMNWGGENLLDLTPERRREIMNRDIAIVFQNPLLSLDPSVRLGEQIQESIPSIHVEGKYFWEKSAHRKKTTIKTLHQVGIRNHDKVMRAYPHEITNDIGQRVMLAMALVAQPRIIIADDPTRGMETTTKTQILRLLTKLNKTRSVAILFVSHDLLAIASMADTMTVLYCGQTVESGKMKHLKKRPLHPYTQALIDSAPSFRKNMPHKSMLPALPGSIPTLQHVPIGCRLGPRCPRAQKECVNVPSPRRIHDHSYSCHFPLHRDKR
jgi:cationic peptide transport system ATP-binding protein